MQVTIESITDATAEDGSSGQQVLAYGAGVSPKRVYIQFWIPSTDAAYGTFTVGQVLAVL